MAPISKILTVLGLSLLVAGQGKQFITGACQSDTDCGSGCCGFKSGKCAGAVVAQERDGGCGFGDAQPNNNAAVALGSTAAAPGVQSGGAQTAGAQSAGAQSAGAANGTASGGQAGAAAGNGQGTQFITGACQSDADCGSGCCGFNSGKCAGAVVAQERDGGCGFGDAQPNNNAAVALGSMAAAPGVQGGGAATGTTGGGQASAAGAATGGAATGAAAGNGQGTQFITGACQSDADCASACCGFKSGKCAGAVVAQERDGGCGFGNAQPNADAANALKGQRLGRRGAAYM